MMHFGSLIREHSPFRALLVYVYARLAHTEEVRALGEFGEEYRRYRDRTPAFVPRLGRRSGTGLRRR
jgi:protein-S-isoprenylcysteine O-methyltransferase Ste14